MYFKAFKNWNCIEVAIENREFDYEGISFFLLTRADALRFGARLILTALGLCKKRRLGTT